MTLHPVPYAVVSHETADERKQRVIARLKGHEAQAREEEAAAPTHYLKAIWRSHAIECAKIAGILGE